MTANLVSDVAKHARNSSPGLYGWTHTELADLLLQAWQQCLEICQVQPDSVLASLSGVYKRVPIPKHGKQAEGSQDTKPIDVLTSPLRTHASAAVCQIRSGPRKYFKQNTTPLKEECSLLFRELPGSQSVPRTSGRPRRSLC